jgi:hypothetical protein
MLSLFSAFAGAQPFCLPTINHGPRFVKVLEIDAGISGFDLFS